MKQITTKYNTLNQSVRDMGEKYRELSEKLELIQVLLIRVSLSSFFFIYKSKTNEHGNNVSDSSPLIRIKAAIQKLRVIFFSCFFC